MKRQLLVITLTALLWAQISMADHRIGTTTAQFLKLGAGAKAISLGEAYTAIAEDATAIYYNPAGLASISGQELTGMYAMYIGDIKYEFIGYARKTDNPILSGGLGLGLLALQSGKIKGWISEEKEADDFDASFYALTMAYGGVLRKDLSVGASLKVIAARIEDERANPSSGMDLAAIYRPSNKLQFGARAQNILGLKMKFIKAKESLPLSLNLGAAYILPQMFKDSQITLLLDLKLPNDNEVNFSTGAEYLFRERFALRIGYRGDIDKASGLSAGLGLRHKNYTFDYAFLPYGDLDNTHRVSLGVIF